jgi:hypothetical protein
LKSERRVWDPNKVVPGTGVKCTDPHSDIATCVWGAHVEISQIIKYKEKYFIFYEVSDFFNDRYQSTYAYSDNLLGPYLKPMKPGNEDVYYLVSPDTTNKLQSLSLSATGMLYPFLNPNDNKYYTAWVGSPRVSTRNWKADINTVEGGFGVNTYLSPLKETPWFGNPDKHPWFQIIYP